MPKTRRTFTYDCYDYDKYSKTITACRNADAIYSHHLNWFGNETDIDLKIRQNIKKGKCIVVLREETSGKLVGIVAANNNKSKFGVNTGRVTEVIYDRDDRDYKKRLNKLKNIFSGDNSKGYVDNLVKYREFYNTPA